MRSVASLYSDLLQTRAMAIRNNLNWHFIPDQFYRKGDKERKDIFLGSDYEDRTNCARSSNPPQTHTTHADKK